MKIRATVPESSEYYGSDTTDRETRFVASNLERALEIALRNRYPEAVVEVRLVPECSSYGNRTVVYRDDAEFGPNGYPDEDEADTVDSIQERCYQNLQEFRTSYTRNLSESALRVVAGIDPPLVIHEVSGRNFHGSYSISLRGPAEGFELSDAQKRKVWKALCGISSCKCGGGYLERAALRGARIICTGISSVDWTQVLHLVPEGEYMRRGEDQDVIA